MSFIIGLAQWLGSFMPRLEPERLFDKEGRFLYSAWEAWAEGVCCQGERCSVPKSKYTKKGKKRK